MKMWMPAAPKSFDYPAETWTFRLDNANSRMAVYVAKVKKYSARDLLVSVTDINKDWRFKPDHYLSFNENATVIDVPIRKSREVQKYRILLDDQYAGACYNYGIFVRENPRLKELGIGFDANYKLRDRYRNSMGRDIDSRLACAIKSAAIKDPEKMLPHLCGKIKLRWIWEAATRPEDLYNYDDDDDGNNDETKKKIKRISC